MNWALHESPQLQAVSGLFVHPIVGMRREEWKIWLQHLLPFDLERIALCSAGSWLAQGGLEDLAAAAVREQGGLCRGHHIHFPLSPQRAARLRHPGDRRK